MSWRKQGKSLTVRVYHVEAMMLGEDFANYLEEMDGCFAFIGGGDHPANHHGKFDFDEKALISGVRLMLTFVIV